jgi:Mrp family chromosome partitioning ATPase
LKPALIPDIKEVTVEYRSVKAKELNKIGRIIVVMSGKGGVGKSLVSGMFAIALKRKGYDISILDADITGPSIPKMFGIKVPPSGFGKSLIKSLPYEVK